MRGRPIHDQYARLPWLIVAMTVSALAIGTIAASYVEGRLVASKGESLALAAAEIAHKLDLLLLEQRDDTLELSRTHMFRDVGVNALSAYLTTVKTTHPIYLWLGVTDAGGRIVAATDPSSIGRDRSRSAWFQGARDTGSIHVSDAEPFEEIGGTEAVSFTAPLLGAGGKLQGTVTTRVGLPALEDVVVRTIRTFQTRTELGGPLEYKFLTATGKVFVDSDLFHKGNLNLRKLGLPSALLSESGKPGYVEEEHLQRHVRVITGYARTQDSDPFSGLTWTVLLHTDKDQLVAPIRGMLWKLAGAWCLIWLPILGFSLWSSKRLHEEWARAQDEHAHAEAAESQYRQLVEQASDIIYRVDLHGYFTYINPTVTRFKGYTQEELIGQHFTEHIRPDARAAARRFYLRQFARKTPSTYYEFPVIKKDGGELWFGQNVQLLMENDQVTGFQAVARDITERKLAEKALRESEERFKAFMSHSPAVAFMKDEAGRYVYVNQTYERLFDSPSAQVVGKTDYDWLPEALAKQLCENDQRVFSSGKPLEVIETVPTPDGRSENWLVLKFPLQDVSGRTLIGGVAVDITTHKRVEEALRKTTDFLRTLIQTSPLAIITLDSDSNVTGWNHAAEEMLGWSEPEVLGKPLPYIPAGKKAEADALWEEGITGSGVNGVEIRRVRKDGSPIDLEVWTRTFRDERGKHVSSVGILADITERKLAEEALQNSRRRLALVLGATNEGLWDWNIKTGEVYYSPQWIESLGFTPEEVPPHISFWESCVHPDDRPGIDEALRAHFSGQTETYQYENRLRLKSGEWRWNLDRGKVVEWDTNGRPLRMVGTDTDITARKRSEERLAKINACFLGFGVSPEQNITRLTALCGELLGAACALYNYLDGPLLRSVGQWNVPADFKPVDPAEGHICLDVIRQGEDRPVTVRNLQATPYAQSDPNVRPYNLQTYFGMAVNCQGSAVGSLCAIFQRDFVPSEADAKLLGIIAAAIGVEEERRQTEADQKRLLEELADSRNRFEMFFRQTPSAISITTIKDGRFLDLNKQAELLTGYSRDELIGRTTVEMNLYVDPSERPGLVQELKQKGMLADLEREIRTKSGEIRTAVFSLVPIHMGSEPCLLSIAHDITARKQAEQRLHERSRQQAIEAELSVLAVTIQDLPNLLSTASGLVLNALEVNYCEVLELIPDATDLRLCASAGWRGDEVGEVRALETGSPAHAALNATKPVVSTLLKESKFGGPQWLHEHGVVTGMSVSIPGKDGPWGVLGVYTTATRTFSRDDVNFLQTVSSTLGTAIERMQTEAVLRSANQSLRQLSRQLLQVQEDDRRAIARDLHDEIGQSLTAIKLNVERAQRTADRDARARIMRDCAQITERVLAQVRDLSLDLHPSILDDLGLAYALKWYADRQAERAGLKVDVTTDPSLPRLPQDVEIACFRIAQEALTNVVRHARANLAGVTLKRGAHAVELCIKDDGIGFVVDRDAAPLNGRSSVGLASMQERAKLLGGTVKISSVPHCGTTVVATLPLPVTSPDHRPAEKARQR